MRRHLAGSDPPRGADRADSHEALTMPASPGACRRVRGHGDRLARRPIGVGGSGDARPARGRGADRSRGRQGLPARARAGADGRRLSGCVRPRRPREHPLRDRGAQHAGLPSAQSRPLPVRPGPGPSCCTSSPAACIWPRGSRRSTRSARRSPPAMPPRAPGSRRSRRPGRRRSPRSSASTAAPGRRSASSASTRARRSRCATRASTCSTRSPWSSAPGRSSPTRS